MMDELHDENENVQNIIAHLEENDVKNVTTISDGVEPVSIKCLCK